MFGSTVIDRVGCITADGEGGFPVEAIGDDGTIAAAAREDGCKVGG